MSTTDFFPPLVDDPADFGAIAAANACSDVFAMGGRVVLAINVAAFPEHFPREAIAAIFDAAAEVVAEAGGTVAGGHTIRNPEPVFGLAVQGLVHPDRVFRKAGARPGDVAAAVEAARHRPGARRRRRRRQGGGHRRDAAPQPRGVRGAAGSSATRVHAVTDVTGLRPRRPRLGGRRAQRRPARASTAAGLRRLPGRARGRRAAACAPAATRATATTWPATSTPRRRAAVEALCLDPQTSGGLLAARRSGGRRRAARRRRRVVAWSAPSSAGEPVVVLR